MSIKVLPETFVQASIETRSYSDSSIYFVEIGNVEIEIRGRRLVVEARRWVRDSFSPGRRDISLIGFVGRYRTSQNPWKASVMFRPVEGRLSANFGRDDRSGRFNKLNAIVYEPETYPSAS